MADQPDGQQQHAALMFYTSSIGLAASGTDIKISFEDSVPPLGGTGEAKGEKCRVALVNMSFHTAKDLSALLSSALAAVEAKLGPIDTSFLQQQRASRPE